jgi:hypothetical protein
MYPSEYANASDAAPGKRVATDEFAGRKGIDIRFQPEFMPTVAWRMVLPLRRVSPRNPPTTLDVAPCIGPTHTSPTEDFTSEVGEVDTANPELNADQGMVLWPAPLKGMSKTATSSNNVNRVFMATSMHSLADPYSDSNQQI